jgi:hypothetical protein
MGLYFQVLLLLVPLLLHFQTLIQSQEIEEVQKETLQTIPQTIPLTVQKMIQSDQTENLDLGDLEWVRQTKVKEGREKNRTTPKNQTRKNDWSLKWSFALKGVSPDKGKNEPILGKNITMDSKSLGGKSILTESESSRLMMMIMVILAQIRRQG